MRWKTRNRARADERGVVDEVEAPPFQTDTCMGDWHYNREAVYKRPKMLAIC